MFSRSPHADPNRPPDAAPEARIRDRHRDLPQCGGKLSVIECIEDPDVIATILAHVRAQTIPSDSRLPGR